MKKSILIIFFLLFRIIVTGQIKKDTVYLYFNHKKDHSYGISATKNNKPFSFQYTYYFRDSLNNKLLISTKVDDYIDFDSKADVKWIDKKFLRKNDKDVYYIKEMQKIGYQNLIDKLYNCVVYLIDTKIRKNNKFKVKEVRIVFFEEM